MKSKLIVRRTLLPVVLALLASSAAAQILGTGARQSPSGSLKLLAYYQGASDQVLNFSVARGGVCGTGVAGVTFACGQGATVEAKGTGSAGMLKIAWQAAERFAPYVVLGAGGYSLNVPSTTVTNSLTSDAPGLTYGAGVKASVVPDTQVSPGAALDLSVTRATHDFKHLSGLSTDQRLTLMTYQLAVVVSHQFDLDKGAKVEPYGGIKWMRVDADLEDRGSGGRAGGTRETASPFLGVRWPSESIAGFAEAAFVDGVHYGAGLEWRFK